MPIGAEARAIPVVVELDEVGTPPEKHRVVRIEEDTQRGAQAARPLVRRSNRRARPVERSNETAHLAAAGEDAVTDDGLTHHPRLCDGERAARHRAAAMANTRKWLIFHVGAH